MQFKNLCPFPVWPGIMTGGGNGPRLPTGFVVLSNASEIFEVPNNWTNGRFWGQTGCETSPDGYFHCMTGDCGTGTKTCIDIEPKPWVTYMEFTLNGPGGYDYYNISLVNGFNLPVKIEPFDQATGVVYTPPAGNCRAPSCAKSLNRVCPPELSMKNDKGHVLACMNPCNASDTGRDCCTGALDSPDLCISTVRHIKLFSEECPQAHSYPFDADLTNYICPTGKDYLITLCPPISDPDLN
ncbi:Thaumatin-like protein 1a [Linum perenne]